jgi:hypothetical protein
VPPGWAWRKLVGGNLIVAEIAMNTRVTFYRTKTISDYPLLVGEILRRAALRDMRKEKWRRFVRKLSLS